MRWPYGPPSRSFLPGAVVSHVSAAVLLGLRVWDVPLTAVHVTRDRTSGGRCGRRLHLHTTPLADGDVVEIDGVPVTAPARTVVDTARAVPFAAGVVVADAALEAGLDPAELQEAVERAGRRPRHARARRVVAFADGAARASASRAAGSCWTRRGIPRPVLQWAVPRPAGRRIGTHGLRLARAAHRRRVRRARQVRPAAAARARAPATPSSPRSGAKTGCATRGSGWSAGRGTSWTTPATSSPTRLRAAGIRQGCIPPPRAPSLGGARAGARASPPYSCARRGPWRRRIPWTPVSTLRSEAAAGTGLATVTPDGTVLDTWYPAPVLGARRPRRSPSWRSSPGEDADRGVRTTVVRTRIASLAEPPADAARRLPAPAPAQPPAGAPARGQPRRRCSGCSRTSCGPTTGRARSRGSRPCGRGCGPRGPVTVYGVDKFPRMVDYVLPTGVRIADADRVRLGAHLAEGTTVMHEGFCNYNAGTLGAVDGRGPDLGRRRARRRLGPRRRRVGDGHALRRRQGGDQRSGGGA